MPEADLSFAGALPHPWLGDWPLRHPSLWAGQARPTSGAISASKGGGRNAMRYRLLGHALLLAAALAFAGGPAFAQGRGRGKQEGRGQDHHDRGHGREHGRGRGGDHGERRYFQTRDRETIVSYYREYRRELPPGLARREQLPPGLERQLRRNGQLPPGLQRRIVWFPPALDRELGPLPYGYRRCWVGDNLLVVNVRTYAIADVMLNFTVAFH